MKQDNAMNDGYDENDIFLRNFDGFGRTLANAYRLYNMADLNRKRLYLERKLNNYNSPSAHQIPISQQSSIQSKEPQIHHQVFEQQQQQQQMPLINANQQSFKRAIDPIGGANLLKRAVDRLGGGHLLKRR